MKNRLLSIVLTLLILAAMAPTTAFAVNYDDSNATENFVIENGVLTQYLGIGYDLHVVIPNGVKEIGYRAFTNHEGIVSITLPDSVVKLDMFMAAGCVNLTDIYIGEGLREMVEVHPQYLYQVDPFYGLLGLQTFHVNSTNPYFVDIDGVLFTTDNELVKYPQGRTGDYRVPDGTVKIRSLAFGGAADIGTLTIPGSVKEIDTVTFNEGTFGMIVLENGVEKIDTKAFNSTVGMIVVPPSVTDIGWQAFVIGTGGEIYGQAGSAIEAYCGANDLIFSTNDPLDPVAPNLNTASAWARDGIQVAYGRGFVPVYLLDNYTDVITRAEFCHLAMKYVRYYTGKSNTELYELAENPSYLRGDLFADVADLAINQDILYAYALGIINGTKAPTATEPGTFDPNGTLTREQAAVMIMNTCNVLGIGNINAPNAGFADMSAVSSWAVDGVNFVKAEGIMNGTGNDNFSPKGTYTRQESIVTFDRIK